MNLLNKPLEFPDFRRLQNMWPKDWTLPFISLALAVALWYFVGGDDTVDKNVIVPIEVINLPRDLVISNQFKEDILVTVSGPRKQVLAIEKGDVARQVDLLRAVPGTMVIKNEIHSISVPRGIKVLRIQPDSIILSLDKLVQKQLVVKPITKGSPASHHNLREIRMKPESISVTGPQTVLAEIDHLETQVIDLTGLNRPTQLQIPLKLSPALLDLIGETSVTADLAIVEETVEKKISGIPIEIEGNTVGKKISPAAVTVTAALPRSVARDNRDLPSLFRATIIDENEAGQMMVRVVSRGGDKGSEPLEILKVEPPFVTSVEDKKLKDGPATPHSVE
jgi:hypothetical protein